MNSRNTTKMVQHKLVLFATVRALWTLVTLRTLYTNKANSHTPKVEIYTRPKLYHFGRYGVRAKLFWLKSFVRSPGWSVHMGKFSSRLPRSRRRESPASHINTSISFTRKRVARRDLGNRASPVDRARMKRPRDLGNRDENFPI